MGYLTIAHTMNNRLILKFPNLEVERYFSKAYLFYIFKVNVHNALTVREKVLQELAKEAFNYLFFVFSTYLHQIPAIARNHNLKEFNFKESYFVSLFHIMLMCYFTKPISRERPEAIGTPDLILELDNTTLIFEAKYCREEDPSEKEIRNLLDTALAQIEKRQYGRATEGKKVYCIAFVVGESLHNVIGFASIQRDVSDQTKYSIYPKGLASMAIDISLKEGKICSAATADDFKRADEELVAKFACKQSIGRSKGSTADHLYNDLIKAQKAQEIIHQKEKELLIAQANAAKETQLRLEAEKKEAQLRLDAEKKGAELRLSEAERTQQLIKSYYLMREERIPDEKIASYLGIPLDALLKIVK